MQKTVKAKKPFIYPNNSNFKLAVWEEWAKVGGQSTGERPLEKFYESLSYHVDLPTLWQNKKEARLCFCEGASLRFDTFPDYLTYEIIPMFWDCWPKYWGVTEKWIKKHNVRTVFFTSSQTADHFRQIFPERNIFHIPEAIETGLYKDEKKLSDRTIDYLEFGRCSRIVDSSKFDSSISVLSSFNEKSGLATRTDLINALSNSKITIALTRLDNQLEIAEGIDTLTQRYWECMLSGVVLLGRAPQELIDFIGYDPTVQINLQDVNSQIIHIKENIESYQELVDKNRQTALQLGDWKLRIKEIRKILLDLGYSL